MNPQIENNFKYHSPKEGQPQKYEDIREKSTAMTNLRSAIMWANVSIGCNE